MKKTLPLRLNGPFPWASERKISRKLPNFLRAAQISLEVVPPKNLVEWSTGIMPHFTLQRVGLNHYLQGTSCYRISSPDSTICRKKYPQAVPRQLRDEFRSLRFASMSAGISLPARLSRLLSSLRQLAWWPCQFRLPQGFLDRHRRLRYLLACRRRLQKRRRCVLWMEGCLSSPAASLALFSTTKDFPKASTREESTGWLNYGSFCTKLLISQKIEN